MVLYVMDFDELTDQDFGLFNDLDVFHFEDYLKIANYDKELERKPKMISF